MRFQIRRTDSSHGAALTDGSRAMAVGDYRSDNAGSDTIQYVTVGITSNASDFGEYHIKTALTSGASFSGIEGKGGS